MLGRSRSSRIKKRKISDDFYYNLPISSARYVSLYGLCKMWECGNGGVNTCKMREIVRVISRILHMVNSDP